MNQNTPQTSVLAPASVIQNTIAGLKSKNMDAIIVNNSTEAMSKIKELIPAGASVMNGASTTLQQIGFIDYLKSGEHGWNNLHAAILAESDPVIQEQLRRQSVLSDFYLGSVHALMENGESIIASNTGSQLPHIVYTSPNLIFVVSTKKIVPNFEAAMKRLQDEVIPLEDQRMMKQYGFGTQLNKIVIFKNENPALGRHVHFILVNEDLGF